MNKSNVSVRWLMGACLATGFMSCMIGGCPPNTPEQPEPQLVPPIIAEAVVDGDLQEGEAGEITIRARVTDSDGSVISVVADLTALGGQPGRALEAGEGDSWTWTGAVTPPAGGTQQVVLTATDSDGTTAKATVDVDVRPGNLPPEIDDVGVTGSLAENQVGSLTLSAHVTDGDGEVVEVTADVSALGGEAAEPLFLEDGNTWTVTVDVIPATAGIQTITFTATDEKGKSGEATATVNVARVVELDGPPVVFAVDGLDDSSKITPGAGLIRNGLAKVQVRMAETVTSGRAELSIVSGADKVAIWSDADRTQAMTLPMTWYFPDDALPVEFYIEGLTLSDTGQDVELSVTYDDPDAVVLGNFLTDTLRFTIVDVYTGAVGYTTDVPAMSIAKVRIPTRYGGRLTVSGANAQLIYTDGGDLEAGNAAGIMQGDLGGSVMAEGNPCSWIVPEGTGGWCYVRLMQAEAASIDCEFVEEGQASYRPWNGWWWPFQAYVGPTLYDAGGPFNKYDLVYGTGAQAWAAAHEAYGDRWFGHCWGWAIASILLPQPQETTKNGIFFTQDDMEGLYTDLANNDPYVDQSLSVSYIPAMPCTSNTGEDVDKYCDDLYRILRTCIRQDGVPILSNMRARANPPNQINEVWNQAIYWYTATFREGSRDSTYIIDMEVGSNFGPWPPPTTYTNDRIEYYTVELAFDGAGQMVTDAAGQNWIYASYYPPHDLYRVTGAPWDSTCPYLTKANVDALYEP